MSILVECSKCKSRNSEKRETCYECFQSLNTQTKMYWIRYKYKGIAKYERIGARYSLAKKVLNSRLADSTEDKKLDIKKWLARPFPALSKWYLALQEVMRKKSHERDIKSIKKLDEYFSFLMIKEITAKEVEKYKHYRLAQNSYRKHLTRPATINRELACLRRMFNLAIRDDMLFKNPVNGVRFENENNKRDRILSDDEYLKLLQNSPSWLRSIFICAYNTGMRLMEILDLKWGRVDFESGFIRLLSDDVKEKSNKNIPLNSELTDVLKNTIRHVNHDYVFTRDGKKIKSIREIFYKVCKESSIENFTFHDFRHTFITNRRREGHDMLSIMKITGHKSVQMYLRYNTVSDDELSSFWRKSGGTF